MSNILLDVKNLSIEYRTREGPIYAVSGASLEIEPGKITALVGESGSGKTSIAHSILQLLPNNARVTSGEVMYRDRDLLTLKRGELREIRGRRVAMIFQNAVAGLNPVLRIGDQVGEVLTNHLGIHKKEAKQAAVRLLASVGMSDPSRIADSYPFQLSGGMCQRVMVAIATALEPDVLIADEPTSSLDVTVQAQVLHEIQGLAARLGTGILLITHNLGIVAQVADSVAVMYQGVIVERGDTMGVMTRPRHPYTYGLLAALPRLDGAVDELRVIGGDPPDSLARPEHCVFLGRCNKVMNQCRTEPHPVLVRDGLNGHHVACYNPIWHAD